MKFSVVIATKNAETLLQRAIVSVLTQIYPHYEIIVQDSCSTDGTVAVLKKFKSRVNWISTPDSGVYDAWNKALDRVTGDWAIFLGADDFLLDKEILARSSAYLKALPGDVLFAYGALAIGENNAVKYILDRPLSSMYHLFLADMGMPFPATFVRVSALKQHRFNPNYKIAGDFDFAARLISPSNVVRLPVRVSFMEAGGLSNNVATRPLLLKERLTVLRTHIAPKADARNENTHRNPAFFPLSDS